MLELLAIIYSYTGSAITTTAEGIRLLLSIPDVRSINWASILTVLPGSPASAQLALPEPANSRVDDKLEANLAALTIASEFPSFSCSQRYSRRASCT